MSATDNGPLAQVTAADVLRWGRAQPADSVIGVCRNVGACLIAEYAERVKGAAIIVHPKGDANRAHYDTTRQRYTLAPDLNRLAIRFDGLSDHQQLMHPADLNRLEATP